MGKAKKVKVSKGETQRPKLSLADQIENEVKPKNRQKIRLRNDEEEEYVTANLTKKILTQARRQQQEIEEEIGLNDPKNVKKSIVTLGSNISDDEQSNDDEPLENVHYYQNIEISEEDERAFEMFMSKNPVCARTLNEIVMEKLTERKTELETHFSDAGIEVQDLDPKLKAMYKDVGDVLAKYRSGKLPKAFKVVPVLQNWEQIVFVMDPSRWSAAAMYQATRIFASNLKEDMAQKFYNLVLLPRIRDDITEYKKLNFHLYQALRKALFKPRGFMKGILLPLLESGTCTLREAIIIGSVISNYSIPLLHSAATILTIARMEYTGASSIFLRIFLDKKYALPFQVVDEVVQHFLRFERDKRELPVLWHQAFLIFVQRYKSNISSEQKEDLLELLKKQSHHSITPEIRRELQHAQCRDVIIDEPMSEPTNFK